ncbi:MAG: hypothetical protein IKR26_02210 [Lachnospiraceae bacterium]|nr:hypothetical protein [Lachnospiraceae bacterium]
MRDKELNNDTDRTVKLGIGLATGRRSFKKVLLSYISIWHETKNELPEGMKVELSLFVSYDLDYQNTRSTDFTNLSQEIVDAFEQIVFMGAKNASQSISKLAAHGEFTPDAIKTVFGSGYAGKRNAVLLSAIEHGMDYLLFLDDDEYPMAVTCSKNVCLWSGQRVFLSHLKEIADADYTNGHHCGYVSPIPQISFDERLLEEDFMLFIEAISNDIISCDKMNELRKTGGVTYSSVGVLSREEAAEVPWINNCRFVSGANLCINLKDPSRTFPFFNPPGARGEDTFLSTLLKDRKVVKVPCYTFHDGFSYYQHILDGALPIRLKSISENSPRIVTRFVNACIGWVRYKPLLVYITQPDGYEEKMRDIRAALQKSIPAFVDYFGDERFLNIPVEFEKYRKNVKRHYARFVLAQNAWKEIIRFIRG